MISFQILNSNRSATSRISEKNRNFLLTKENAFGYVIHARKGRLEGGCTSRCWVGGGAKNAGTAGGAATSRVCFESGLFLFVRDSENLAGPVFAPGGEGVCTRKIHVTCMAACLSNLAPSFFLRNFATKVFLGLRDRRLRNRDPR